MGIILSPGDPRERMHPRIMNVAAVDSVTFIYAADDLTLSAYYNDAATCVYI